MDTPEEPLFLAKDVKEWIEHNNITLMLDRVDYEEKLTYAIHNSGQRMNQWFLTEDGLYEVLMQSRKPIAKKFKKEVKNILKQIRMTGGYIRIIEGGFGPDQKVILAKTVAKIYGVEMKYINKLIPANNTEGRKCFPVNDLI